MKDCQAGSSSQDPAQVGCDSTQTLYQIGTCNLLFEQNHVLASNLVQSSPKKVALQFDTPQFFCLLVANHVAFINLNIRGKYPFFALPIVNFY